LKRGAESGLPLDFDSGKYRKCRNFIDFRCQYVGNIAPRNWEDVRIWYFILRILYQSFCLSVSGVGSGCGFELQLWMFNALAISKSLAIEIMKV